MKPPFTYFGGKTRIAGQIAALLPAHEHYVEPFAGSLAVLLAKPPSMMETVSDLDGDLMNFWRVLRDRPHDLERACALTPHSRAEHQGSYEPAADDLERARRIWIRLTQGRSGQHHLRTGWRYYQRRKRDPGRCYLKAGFRHVGFTAGGLHAFQMLPSEMPEPLLVPGAQASLFDLIDQEAS